MPWKWIDVVSFPKLFCTVSLTVSPILTYSGGHGHCPLIPTKGRTNPPGAANTHSTFQLYATIFAVIEKACSANKIRIENIVKSSCDPKLVQIMIIEAIDSS
jgi:hypothetical protein